MKGNVESVYQTLQCFTKMILTISQSNAFKNFILMNVLCFILMPEDVDIKPSNKHI